MCQLHGPLRLRAHRRRRHHGLPARVPPRRHRRLTHVSNRSLDADCCFRGTKNSSLHPDCGWVGPMLETLTGPERVRALPASALPALAEEIRQVLIESVPRTGGHFGPNLGVVELTIALHRVFHSPHDAIVWDTGHQAYVHKLLTGRRDGFATLRSAGGLSGYPSRAESTHDLVEN